LFLQERERLNREFAEMRTQIEELEGTCKVKDSVQMRLQVRLLDVASRKLKGSTLSAFYF
jgi:hypothetical protein